MSKFKLPIILLSILVLIYIIVSNGMINNHKPPINVVNKDELSILTDSLIQAKKDNDEKEMVKIASQRKDMLIQKLPDNPQEFLNYATLGPERLDFPDQVRPLMEEEVEIQGKVILVISDDFKNQKSKIDYFLESSEDRFTLHFAGIPPELSSGSEVLVKGVRLDNNIVLPSDF